jgi:hypothetical protein
MQITQYVQLEIQYSCGSTLFTCFRLEILTQLNPQCSQVNIALPRTLYSNNTADTDFPLAFQCQKNLTLFIQSLKTHTKSAVSDYCPLSCHDNEESRIEVPFGSDFCFLVLHFFWFIEMLKENQLRFLFQWTSQYVQRTNLTPFSIYVLNITICSNIHFTANRESV